MSKYGNRKVKLEIDGNTQVFDSIVERDRYLHLKRQQDQGLISGLELQVKYILQEKWRRVRDKKAFREITYSADFRYQKDGATVVEDVKGMKTEVYKIKAKMLVFQNKDIQFVEVTRKQGRWIESVV